MVPAVPPVPAVVPARLAVQRQVDAELDISDDRPVPAPIQSRLTTLSSAGVPTTPIVITASSPPLPPVVPPTHTGPQYRFAAAASGCREAVYGYRKWGCVDGRGAGNAASRKFLSFIDDTMKLFRSFPYRKFVRVWDSGLRELCGVCVWLPHTSIALLLVSNLRRYSDLLGSFPFPVYLVSEIPITSVW